MNREIKYKGHEFACHINKNGEVVYWCWNCKGYYPKNKMSTETIESLVKGGQASAAPPLGPAL